MLTLHFIPREVLEKPSLQIKPHVSFLHFSFLDLCGRIACGWALRERPPALVSMATFLLCICNNLPSSSVHCSRTPAALTLTTQNIGSMLDRRVRGKWIAEALSHLFHSPVCTWSNSLYTFTQRAD